MTIAAEQFGTNIRSTVTTTVPNFARGTLVPVTFMYTELTPSVFTPITTAAILAVFCYLVALYCIMTLEESFDKDMDFLEMKLVSPSPKA